MKWIIILIALWGIACCLMDCENTGCIEYKVVKTVGGCGHDGHCGIMFEDGTAGDPYRFSHPVPGQSLCVKYGKVK